MKQSSVLAAPGVWINNVCCFLTLEDISSFAETCKAVNCIKLESETVHKIVEIHPIASKVDTQFIDFYQPTLASLRKNLFHVVVGTLSSTMQIDPSGRRMLDRSFSQRSMDSNTEAYDNFDGEGEEEIEVGSFIDKHLESASFDEYDDFNPRHPEYRGQRGHRRGGSCFNSDISDVVDMVYQDDPSLSAAAGSTRSKHKSRGSGSMAMLAQMALDSLDIADS